MTNRAKRRAALAKRKARARRLYPTCPLPERLANNLTPCSCSMCGNPRRHFGKRTVQERKEIEHGLEC